MIKLKSRDFKDSSSSGSDDIMSIDKDKILKEKEEEVFKKILFFYCIF